MKGFVDLLNAKWNIEPNYGRKLAAIAYLVMNKQWQLNADLFGLKSDAQSAHVLNIELPSEHGESVMGRVGVLVIDGPMVRQDQLCGPEGTISMGRAIQRFDADSSIDAIVIQMHTPGGQTSGGETFANIVANTNKPVVVHGELICSLGYKVAAGSSHIMLSGKNAMVGSIGTAIYYYDETKKLQKEGIESIEMVATASPDKNAYNFDNPTEEDKTKIVTEIIDPLNNAFLNHIQMHRPQVETDAKTGKVYYAEQAIELGLADSIGTFEDAVNLALAMSGKLKLEEEMAETPTAATNSTANDDGLRQQLEAAQTTIKALNGQVATQADLIQQLQQTNTAQEGTINALQKRIDQLAQQPSDDPEAAPVGIATDDATTQIETLTPKQSNDPVTQAVIKKVREAQAARRKKGGTN